MVGSLHGSRGTRWGGRRCAMPSPPSRSCCSCWPCVAPVNGLEGWSKSLRRWRRQMTSNDGCSRWRRVALGLVMSLLSGCAAGGFDGDKSGDCLPVIQYSREEQARAAEELELLPEGAVIVEMMADYSVMREQVRGCQQDRHQRLVTAVQQKGLNNRARTRTCHSDDANGQCCASGGCEVCRNSHPSTPRCSTISIRSATSPADRISS